jgi:hypothetical protein
MHQEDVRDPQSQDAHKRRLAYHHDIAGFIQEGAEICLERRSTMWILTKRAADCRLLKL